MRIRPGIVRGLIAALVVFLLVVPVGTMRSGRPEPASVGASLGDLATGNLGVGILDGFVAGGSLAREAGLRVLLAALGIVAFWLAGASWFRWGGEEPPAGRRRCPYCQEWASAELRECPACGRGLG